MGRLEKFRRPAGSSQEQGGTLIERYFAVRKHTAFICEPLLPEDYTVQPALHVSPAKWHLAHTTWFFEEFILSKHVPNYRRFHPRYAYLFNSYYERVGEHLPRTSRGNLSRPTVSEIHEYRGYVDEHMIQLFADLPEEVPDIIELGINHEQQHQELLYTDIKYVLGNNPLFPEYHIAFQETPEQEHDHSFVELPEGEYSIGSKGRSFSFDNERPAHRVYLNRFSIRKSLVTNAEYLEFIQDGGYQQHEHWLSDGWQWVRDNNISYPFYWMHRHGVWYRYALSGLEKIRPDDPVTHVSFYEAAAFAAWRGMRLPTEFEWEAAAPYLDWGLRWEHTNSAFLPYPGFRAATGLLGEYNGKFMVNNMVLRGGSVVTPASHSRPTYRNFFHPALRWQFNGIRLCRI